MGEYISVGESLLITVFSMIVVFIVLIAISYLIDLLRIVINREDKEEVPAKVASPASASQPVVDQQAPESAAGEDEEELVAVIAAALAASMGVGVEDINIRSINRRSPSQPAWAQAGRNEQILHRL